MKSSSLSAAKTWVRSGNGIGASLLRRAVLSFPWMTGKTVLAIYWQALRLLLKRTPLYSHLPAQGSWRVARPTQKDAVDEKL